MFEFAKESLDGVSLFIDFPITDVWVAPIRPWWDDRGSARVSDGIMEMVGVIGSVCNDVLRFQPFYQGFSIDDITAITRSQDKAHGQAKRVHGGVDFSA